MTKRTNIIIKTAEAVLHAEACSVPFGLNNYLLIYQDHEGREVC